MAGPAIKRGGGVKERAIKEKRTFLVSYIWIFFYMESPEFYTMPGVLYKARSSIKNSRFLYNALSSIQFPEISLKNL